MKPSDRAQTPEPVDVERALEHARLTFRRDWAGGVAGFERWYGFEVEKKPLVIHDINGAELFYDFTVTDGENEVGCVRTSASRTLGVAVASVEMGARRWKPDKALRGAQELTRKRFPKGKIVNSEFVCFSYPKVGVRVDVQVGSKGLTRLVYDASDLSEIPAYGADEREGFTAWSFYEEVAGPCAESKVHRWDLADLELDAVRKRDKGAITAAAFTEREALKYKDIFVVKSSYEFLKFISSRVLKYGPRCSPHDCFMLYAQQTNVFCAVATGQMILDFHRWPFTQNEIATAMSTDSGGTTNPNQVAGYESLTHNTLLATYDTSADWAEAKAEIDANRPVKSGIPGHARACAGWKRQNISIVLGQGPKRWLQIYDPWPWNSKICEGGAVVWEDWDTVNHTNFIYVRHRTTDC
jgi:hypothetical protein